MCPLPLLRAAALVCAFAASLLVFPVLLAGAASSSTSVVTLNAAADTYLRSGASDTNEGASSFVRVRASGDNRGLVRFDQPALQAAVGSGTLVSAALQFTVTDNGNNWGSSGRTISVYRVTSSWAEGNGFVDRGSPSRRGTGPGATWNCASDAAIQNTSKDCSGATVWEMGKPSQPALHPWAEPATASTLITNGLAGTIGFDVTADVQRFIAGTPNDGWIIKKDIEGAAGLIEFGSRETGNLGPRLALVVDRSTVDATPPDVTAEGDFVERGVSDGTGSLDVHFGASDDFGTAGFSGISRIWIEDGSTEIVSFSAPCSPGCLANYERTSPIDVSTLGEGTHSLTARATDGAGNVGESIPSQLLVDRTPPGAASAIGIAFYATATAAVTVAWQDATDGPLADGSEGTGIGTYDYRYRFDGGLWSSWITTPIPGFELGDTPLGTGLDVEVRTRDNAGNIGTSVVTSLTVFDAGEPPAQPTDDEPGTVVELTNAQRSEVMQIAVSDPLVSPLLVGRGATATDAVPLSVDDASGVVGAHVTVTFATPLTLETDWPMLEWDPDGVSYEQIFVHFRADNVTSLDVVVDLRVARVVGLDVDVNAAVGPATLLSSLGSATLSHQPQLAVAAASGGGEGNNIKASAKNLFWVSGRQNPQLGSPSIKTRTVPQLGSDFFFNWDFHEKTYKATKADWPINLVFDGEASISTAKDLWNRGQASFFPGLTRLWATPQYSLVFDSPPSNGPDGTTLAGGWDSDKGVYKGGVCGYVYRGGVITPPGIRFNVHKWHYRVYAPEGQDRFFNRTLGYYVIASSHQDHNDSVDDPIFGISLCPGDWYGGSERAEQEVAQAASAHPGWTVHPNAINMHNPDHRRWIKNRYYENSGKATEITIGGTAPDLSLLEAPGRPVSTVPPTITGNQSVGAVLTAQPGSWDSSVPPAFSYQWLRCDATGNACNRIGPDQPQYTLSAADEGATVRVDVVASTPLGLAKRLSSPTGPIAPVGGSLRSSPLIVTGGPILYGVDTHRFTGCGGVCLGSVFELVYSVTPGSPPTLLFSTPPRTPNGGTGSWMSAMRPTWSFDHTRFAYLLGDNGSGTLVISDASGAPQTHVNAIVPPRYFEGVPRFSPDGSKLLVGERNAAGQLELRAYGTGAPSDGVSLGELSGTNAYAWDGDGHVLMGRNAGGIVRVNADGADVRVIASGRLPGSLALSWDGTTLAFDCDNGTGICTTPMQENASVTTIYPGNGSVSVSSLAWSPDRSKIAFDQIGINQTTARVQVIPSQGGQATDVAGANCALALGPSWEVNSSRLAFRCSHDGIFTYSKTVTIATAQADGGGFAEHTPVAGATSEAAFGDWGPFGASANATPYYGE